MEVRRATEADEQAVLSLIGAEAFIVTKRFGNLNIAGAIETAVLSLVTVDRDGAVTGFACFADRPCDTVKQAKDWEGWIKASYEDLGYSSYSTSWLSCFVADHRAEFEVFHELMRTAFDLLPASTDMLYMLPDGEQPFEPVNSLFEPVPAVGAGKDKASLLVCPRAGFLPSCKVRRARIEDHDDLVPIFEKQSEMLSDQYGEFFLADIIASSALDETPQEALVAEVHGRAVGLIVVSSEVDIPILQDCFDLQPYGGLMRYTGEGVDPSLLRATDATEVTQLVGEPEPEPEPIVAGIVIANHFKYKNPEDKDKVLATLDKILDYNKEMNMLGPVASTFAFKHEEDGLSYKATEVFADAAAYETYAGSFSACPFMEEIMAMAEMVEEMPDGVVLYGDLAEMEKSPMLTTFYPTQQRVDGPPDMSLFFGIGEFGWIVVRPEMPGDKQRKIWREVFDALDKDEEGTISFVEFFEQAGAIDNVASEMFSDIAGEDFRISWEEFDKTRVLKLWRLEFDQLDADDDGKVSFVEFFSRATAISGDMVNHFNEADVDGDQVVSWEEFVVMHEEAILAAAAAAEEENPDDAAPRTVQDLLDDLEVNCFVVTMFCMDERFASRARDLVAPIFTLFPDCDYCILTQPYLSPEPALLESFVQVMPKPCNTFRDCLYVMHRSMTTNVTVRPSAPSDVGFIDELVDGLESQESINGAFASLGAMDAAANKKNKSQGFVFEYMGKVVGCAVLKGGVEVPPMADAFEIEDHISLTAHGHDGHVTLSSFVLLPIFGGLTRACLHQMLRQAGKTVLYLQEEMGGETSVELNLRRVMVQVKPRSQIQLPPASWAPAEGNWVGADQHEKTPPQYALHYFATKVTTKRKAARNTRIVVVGSSSTAKGCLEQLVLLSDVVFPHITLLMDGEGSHQTGGLCTDHCFGPGELERLALDGKVQILRGRMVDVDRDGRMVVLADGALLPYDYLVLTTGLQESAITGLGAAAAQLAGIFALNSPAATSEMLSVAATAAKVVLYGSSLNVLGAVSGLIEAGVAPSSIALVSPSTVGDVIANGTVANKLTELLKATGVTCYDGHTLTRAEGNAEGRLISAIFENKATGKAVGMSCDVLASYHGANVDPDVAVALNDNALVYDGRLVINSCFQTNDPSILAAGSLAKYSRRYGKQLPLSAYSSREVGAALGQTILDFAVNDGAGLDTDKVPKMLKPKAVGCTLPGNTAYFHAALPVVEAAAVAGRDLETDTANGFMSVHVDAFDVITGITYFGAGSLEWGNLMRLLGQPQGYVNRLCWHYDEGKVADLTDWFRQPWAMALYHDRFAELAAALAAEIEGDDVEAVRAGLQEWGAAQMAEGGPGLDGITMEMMVALRAPLVKALDVSTRRGVKNTTAEFIGNNVSQLSMICEPAP